MSLLANNAYSKMAGQVLTEAVNVSERLPYDGTNLSSEEIGRLGELCTGAFIAPIRRGKISVPREYRDSEHIGVAVIEHGAKYALDRSFLTPTPKQFESAAEVLEQEWGLADSISGREVVKDEISSARAASYFPGRGNVWFEDKRSVLGIVDTRHTRLQEDQYRWTRSLNGTAMLLGRPLMVLTVQPGQTRPTMDTFFHELEHVRQAVDRAAYTVPDAEAEYPECELYAHRIGGAVAEVMQREQRLVSSSAQAQIAVESVRRRHAAHEHDFTITHAMKQDLGQEGLLGYVFSA